MIEVQSIISFNKNYKYWFIKGTEIWHREDGPAIEFSDGSQEWYQHGKLHRLNGPAIEYYDGSKAWYYKGKRIPIDNQEDFERYIKLMAFE